MKVLIACEESQAVCKAFRKLGHEAYSCDIIEPSGSHPEWHILGDALEALKGGQITTMDGVTHDVGKWDLLIAHPPCTYLSAAGNRWFNVERYGERAIERAHNRDKAARFFMQFINADVDRIAVENPIGAMSTRYKKPTQIVQPYWFGDAERKPTCLWLKGLPPLQPTNMVEPNIVKYKNGKGTDCKWHMDTIGLPPAERAKARSKTFPGIAKAMAEQWGGVDG